MGTKSLLFTVALLGMPNLAVAQSAPPWPANARSCGDAENRTAEFGKKLQAAINDLLLSKQEAEEMIRIYKEATAKITNAKNNSAKLGNKECFDLAKATGIAQQEGKLQSYGEQRYRVAMACKLGFFKQAEEYGALLNRAMADGKIDAKVGANLAASSATVMEGLSKIREGGAVQSQCGGAQAQQQIAGERAKLDAALKK